MPGLDTAFAGITNLVLRSKIRDDDGVDQLHHFVTVTILAAFAAITGIVEYAGEPINCWIYGDYLMKHYQDHVNQYCWTHSLYHYPDRSNRTIMPFPLNSHGAPEDPEAEMRGEEYGKITFYRWVTIIFLVQAFLFKFPNLLWGEYNSYAGSNIVKMVEMLQDVIFTKEEEKKEKLRQVALFLEQWLRIQRKPHWFLRPDASPVNLAQSTPVPSTSKTFPLVALCHFQTYDFAGVATQASSKGKWMQCILTINMFLEKLFLLEWFWLLVLFALTAINFVHWCFKILRTTTAIKFVQRYMKLMGYYSEPVPVPKNCSDKQFVTEYLLNDGVFVLRILAVNTNEVVVAQLVEELWKRYHDYCITHYVTAKPTVKSQNETRAVSASGSPPPATSAPNTPSQTPSLTLILFTVVDPKGHVELLGWFLLGLAWVYLEFAKNPLAMMTESAEEAAETSFIKTPPAVASSGLTDLPPSVEPYRV